jgi:pyruvate,orthophosphate dikinase
VILVRAETSPEDIHGMHAGQGILTARGGMTSHAAVVARGMGKALRLRLPASSQHRRQRAGTCGRAAVVLQGRRLITIDGSTARSCSGACRRSSPELAGDFAELMAGPTRSAS